MRAVIVVLLAIGLAPAPEGAANVPTDTSQAVEQPPDAWAEPAAPVDLVDAERPRALDVSVDAPAGRASDRPPLRPPIA